MSQPAEVWLRGPIPGLLPPLQPVAHALLQIAEEIPPLLDELTPEQIWARPGGSGSIGFHAVHLAGSLDRLFTYSLGRGLSPEQMQALAAERTIDQTRPPKEELLRLLQTAFDVALAHLKTVHDDSLFAPREVGRARLPSNTFGLLVHAAEHSARHAGQLTTLAKVVRGTAPGAA
jgi:uncharacterized damage-inducible protein DinB